MNGDKSSSYHAHVTGKRVEKQKRDRQCGVKEVAGSQRCLPCRSEDLTSNPRMHFKKGKKRKKKKEKEKEGKKRKKKTGHNGMR